MCTIEVFYVTYHGDFQLVDSMDRLSISPEGFLALPDIFTQTVLVFVCLACRVLPKIQPFHLCD
jgi:hypothetical protein